MAIRLSHSCFNPRARKGRDIGTRGHFQHGHVSIHAPARGATPLDRLTRQTMPFQSTRPQGARRLGALDGALGDEFQSTRPQGARLRQSSAMIFVVCFNPRARKGRDQGGRRGREAHGVSIHAPARGATGHGRGHGPVQVVSIHAPARGATCARASPLRGLRCFNPRARKGRDEARVPHRRRRRVSIHAPARGATMYGDMTNMGDLVFQSTRPQGARLLPVLRLRRHSGSFNPRARKGRDYNYWSRASAPHSFNPRARKGRDCSTRRTIRSIRCFNPRARKGRDSF